MAKNNDLINRYKYFMKQNKDVLPAIFSSLALAMFESNIDPDDIEYLFAKSQEIWRNHVGNVSDMIKLCEEKTGIDVKAY